MALVFQYGSNCSSAEINGDNRLCGDATFVGIAQTVEGYRLAFDVYSTRRGCAASDIVPTAGSTVWGVLYEVPDWLMNRETAAPKDRQSFDAIEGEGSNYRRVQIDVRQQNGQVVRATTYVVINPQAGLRTSVEYVRLIVIGLREHEVDPQYIDAVKSIAAANNPQIAESVRLL